MKENRFNIGDRVRTDTYYPNPIGDHIGTITKFKMIGDLPYVSVILDEIQNEFSIDGEFLIPPEHLISMTGSILKYYNSNEEINVFWNPELCQHAGECIRGNSKVFDASRRPWVDISAAPSKEIAEIIDRCPSGALLYELK